jgi:hypothetical protein
MKRRFINVALARAGTIAPPVRVVTRANWAEPENTINDIRMVRPAGQP